MTILANAPEISRQTTRQKKIVLIRPGAVGDVLIARYALITARKIYPGAEIILIAPGERGKLLQDSGRLADTVLDWDSSDCAWLFSTEKTLPTGRLAMQIGYADKVIAYLTPPQGKLVERLNQLGCADVAIVSPQPQIKENSHLAQSTPIYADSKHFHIYKEGGIIHRYICASWLNNADSDSVSDINFTELPSANINISTKTLENLKKELKITAPYVVLHPGSSGVWKNWPSAAFAELGNRLAKDYQVVVTAGEADGMLGRKVAEPIKNAILSEGLLLTDLSALLAGAAAYIGNDSGISHLASCCCVTDSKSAPICVVVFVAGTIPGVWAPPNVCIYITHPAENTLQNRPVESRPFSTNFALQSVKGFKSNQSNPEEISQAVERIYNYLAEKLALK